MKLELDSDSPIPIYHQIAEAIRRKIHLGELAPGARLASLREAAEHLGVNLHTVRHAYAELAREGLLESRRAAGTRVTERKPTAAPSRRALHRYVGRILSEASDEFGLTAKQLADAILEHPQATSATPPVAVLECSPLQCADLAHQIEARWQVRAFPWCLDQGELPADGALVATYFHYNEIRRRWPKRLNDVHFVSISPDPKLPTQVRRAAEARPVRPILCELDAPTLQAVAADLSLVLPEPEFELAQRVLECPEQALELPDDRPLLLPPRLWGTIDRNTRKQPHLIHARYVFNESELDSLAQQLEWSRTP